MMRFFGYPFGYMWALPNTLIGLACLPFTLISGGRVAVPARRYRNLWRFLGVVLRNICGVRAR